MSGTLSSAERAWPHAGQRDPGKAMDSSRGTRWMTTLRNDPMAAPKSAAVSSATIGQESEALFAVNTGVLIVDDRGAVDAISSAAFEQYRHQGGAIVITGIRDLIRAIRPRGRGDRVGIALLHRIGGNRSQIRRRHASEGDVQSAVVHRIFLFGRCQQLFV